MRYIADTLTLIRLILAFVVAVCISNGRWMLALVLFGVAVLSDALDGICARRWPYTQEEAAHLPWRKIDPHTIDNIPDLLMVALATIALLYKIDYWRIVMVVMFAVSGVFYYAVMLLVSRGKTRAAEMTDVVFGWWFVATIGMVVAEIAYRAGVLVPVIIIAAVLAGPIFWLKRDRATSRPETRAAAERNA